MKRNSLLSFALIIAMLVTLCACSSEKKPEAAVSTADVSAVDVSAADVSPTDWISELSDDELAVAQVIVSSTDAFNRGDIDGYMAFVDPKSSAYSDTQDAVKLVFDRYQLEAVIDDLDVTDITDSTATVTVTQTTAPVETGKYSFTPVQTTLNHTLTNRDGKWYITSTVVENRVELVDYWGLFIDFAKGGFSVSSSDAMPAEVAELE